MTIGRESSPEAELLSAELRKSTTDALLRRRRVAALSLASAASMGLITLYQMGVVDHLPEPSLPRLDADKVDASGEAYAILRTPDAALGLLSYAGTAVLAAAGGADRARRSPWLPLALAAKVGFDALGSALLTAEQASRHKKFCSWCLLAAGATAAMVPAVIPEARLAWQNLRGSK
jgi:uncharacterized membrane protein